MSASKSFELALDYLFENRNKYNSLAVFPNYGFVQNWQSLEMIDSIDFYSWQVDCIRLIVLFQLTWQPDFLTRFQLDKQVHRVIQTT